ncbi:MAG TPA: hypothetical protein GXZ90_04455 [Clostridiales bacterium]|nr:hypothetical protein [Clostridiales bacterium]
MRRRKGGAMGNVVTIFIGLVLFGIFLAVLNQFGGDLGALFQWLLNGTWNFITSVRDSISSWSTFQRLF